MNKKLQIYAKNQKPIYIIIPGFIGNYQEGFIKRLYIHLKNKGENVYGVKFKGHNKNEKNLANPVEMARHLKNEYLKIKKKYPSKKIIILAHSQGSAITLKCHWNFKKSTKLIFMAPAIFLDEIILPRISKDDIKLMKSGTPTKTKVSKDKFRILDKKWVSAYENFNIKKTISKIRQNCIVIRPNNDFIERENALILKKIPQNSYFEIKGNHWFDEPSDSFENLVKKISI